MLNVNRDLGVQLVKAGYTEGHTYKQCRDMAKQHPEMDAFLSKLAGERGHIIHRHQFRMAKMEADRFIRERKMREPEDNGFFYSQGKLLKDAGYEDNDSYEECIRKAENNTEMQQFLQSLPGEIGSEDHIRQFSFAVLCLKTYATRLVSS